MSIPASAELITGMKIVSTVPLLARVEKVKASAPAPAAAPALAGPTLAEQVAKIRREMGAYVPIYSFLLARLETLRQQERGVPGRVPPSGRARGGADAIDGVLVLMKPLVEGTASAGHAATMKKEIGRLRDAAREKAKAGDIPAMGAFDQLSAIHKQL